MTDKNIWDQILDHVRAKVDDEEFRHWFSGTAYASDSGDHIVVWVPTEAMRRHLTRRYNDLIDGALTSLDRSETQIRFVVAGVGDEDEDE